MFFSWLDCGWGFRRNTTEGKLYFFLRGGCCYWDVRHSFRLWDTSVNKIDKIEAVTVFRRGQKENK